MSEIVKRESEKENEGRSFLGENNNETDEHSEMRQEVQQEKHLKSRCIEKFWDFVTLAASIWLIVDIALDILTMVGYYRKHKVSNCIRSRITKIFDSCFLYRWE